MLVLTGCSAVIDRNDTSGAQCHFEGLDRVCYCPSVAFDVLDDKPWPCGQVSETLDGCEVLAIDDCNGVHHLRCGDDYVELSSDEISVERGTCTDVHSVRRFVRP